MSVISLIFFFITTTFVEANDTSTKEYFCPEHQQIEDAISHYKTHKQWPSIMAKNSEGYVMALIPCSTKSKKKQPCYKIRENAPITSSEDSSTPTYLALTGKLHCPYKNADPKTFTELTVSVGKKCSPTLVVGQVAC